MAGGAQLHPAGVVDDGGRCVHAVGGVGPREQPVELAERGHEVLEVGEPGPHARGQLGQDPGRLLLFLAQGLHEVVVRLDQALRLDEDRLAALRAVVHDAAHALARLGPHRQHVAAVAYGDEPVGKEAIALGGEHALEVGDDPAAAIPDLLAKLAEAGAGAVGEAAVVLEGLAERVAQVGQAGPAVGERGHGGRDRADGPAPGLYAGAGVERGNEQHELGPVQRAALGGGAGQHRSHVGDAVERGRALGVEGLAGFTGERDRGLDGGDVDERRGVQGLLSSHGGPGFAREEGSDRVPLGASIHDTACRHAWPHSLPLRGNGSSGVRSVAAGVNRTPAPGARPSCGRPGPCVCGERSAFRPWSRDFSPPASGHVGG